MRKSFADGDKLTDCEKYIMKIIWTSSEDLGMIEITQRVFDRYQIEWKTQTVSTFLARLVKKEFIYTYRKGRIFYYHPIVLEADYAEKVIDECIDLWSDGDVSKLVLSLYNNSKLSRGDIEKIRNLLDEIVL